MVLLWGIMSLHPTVGWTTRTCPRAPGLLPRLSCCEQHPLNVSGQTFFGVDVYLEAGMLDPMVIL